MPQFQKQQLANGLTVVAEVNPDAHTSAVGFFVKAGTRDEDPAVMGVSHFLEHMMFKGTARRSADDVNREFDEMGANYNAFTSQEMTVYYAQTLPEHLPWAVDLLGDILRPALREEDFNVEKKVILEEISMYDDRPQWRLNDAIHEAHYRDHPLAYRVLGTQATVGGMSAVQMRSYFEHRYSSDNITVAAAGRVDFDRLVREVEKATAAWKPTGAARQYVPPLLTGGDISLADERVTRHYVALICPGPSAQDPLRYAAKVFSDVVGDSDGSRLYWALIDPGLADEADFSVNPMDQAGAMFAYASCDPARAAEVESILIRTIDQAGDTLTEAELERAKNKVATAATLAAESPGGRMRGVGGQWVYLREYLPLEVELERIMAVTMSDIRQWLAAMPLKPRTIVRLGPKSA